MSDKSTYAELMIRTFFISKINEEQRYNSSEETDGLINKAVEAYIRGRGGLQKIQEDLKILDEAFKDVKKAFEEANNEKMEYFQKREHVIPALRRFYQKIKELYTDKTSYFEYKDYMTRICDMASEGAWYPYIDEVEHETIEGEPERTLDIIAQQARKEICSRKGIRSKWFFWNKCMDCQRYLNEELKKYDNIQNVPFDTYQDAKIPYYQHSINIVKINGKKYIIDPTYVQFCDVRTTPDIVGVPGYLGGVPGQYLMDSDKKREFLHNLVKYGFFEVTEENLKMYFDSFVLANRSGEFYANHPKSSKMETEFSGNDYIEMLLGKKVIDVIGEDKSKII